MAQSNDIIVPFIGGTAKFLNASSFLSKSGQMIALGDRIEVYTDRKEPAKFSKESFLRMLECVDNHEDVKAWLGLVE